MTTSYYRGTHCCVLVFDITNPESFFSLFKWIDQYNAYNEMALKQIVIAGNKHDLESKRKVSVLEIKQFCESMQCDYVEVSVLEDKGIDKLLDLVMKKCMQLNKLQGGTGGKGTSNLPKSLANVKPLMLSTSSEQASKKRKQQQQKGGCC